MQCQRRIHELRGFLVWICARFKDMEEFRCLQGIMSDNRANALLYMELHLAHDQSADIIARVHNLSALVQYGVCLASCVMGGEIGHSLHCTGTVTSYSLYNPCADNLCCGSRQ